MTADNEREHASILFKLINELKKNSKGKYDVIGVEAEAPTVYGSTMENLRAAIEGENYEHSRMYPEFASVAEQEGLIKIAGRLRSIAKAEEHHEERYMKILKQLEAGTFFKKPQSVWWYCRECGYMHFGPEPPQVCPACEHPKSFYQLL